MIQTTNIRRILDRVMRHPMMRDVPFETAVEYAVDFISLIGTPALYEEKTAIISIHDWRGPLPCDFEQMIQVRVAPRQSCGCWKNFSFPVGQLTYRESGYSFHMSDIKPGNFSSTSLTYKTQGMVIFTSTKDVDVEIAYRGFMVDDEGYPLLPDNTSFLRGLENYVKLQWFTVLFDMGKISAQVLSNAQQEYAWAAGDAQSEFSRLNLDSAETLFNSFKTILPRNHEHWKAFFTNGSMEVFHGSSVPTSYYHGTTKSTRGIRLASDSGIVTPVHQEEVVPEPEATLRPPVIICDDNLVTITCSTTGAQILFRRASETEWALYQEPIPITQDTFFYAYSTLGGEDSSVVTFMAYYQGTPIHVYPPDYSVNNNTVTLSCFTDGASIYYRSTATPNWTLYTEPIQLTNTIAIDAYAVVGSYQSEMVSFTAYYDGGEPQPVPEQLVLPIYYGGGDNAINLNDSIEDIVNTFDSSRNYTTDNVWCGEKYYYISVPDRYTIASIVTVNTENITALFELKTSYSHGANTYRLYEFHLSSNIPLDVLMTITIAK